MSRMVSRYLTHWDRCEITTRQGAMLVSHLAVDQLPNTERFHSMTVRTLLERCWLRRDDATNATSLTERGRWAAVRAAAAFADKMSPSPPLVPSTTPMTVKEMV